MKGHVVCVEILLEIGKKQLEAQEQSGNDLEEGVIALEKGDLCPSKL